MMPKFSTRMLSVLVIDEEQSRAAETCSALALKGYQVAALLPDTFDLSQKVQNLHPDVILIHTESPSRDTLEHLAVLERDMPRPVLMFSNEKDGQVIRQAMRSGVSTYMVEGIAPERIEPLIEVAIAQFEEYSALKRERDEATKKLTDRVLIDKAKGILMKARNLDEDAAYKTLRKLAMDRGQPLITVANDVISMAKLLL